MIRRSALALLCLGVASAALSAEKLTRFDIATYGTPLIYKDSVLKKDGYFIGTYFYYGRGYKHLLEGAVDFTRINYKSGFKLDQYDFTVSYTNYSFRNLKLRIGTHYLSNNDPWTDKGIVVFGEVTRYKLYKWDAGFESYVTYYPDYPSVGGSDKGLFVYQLNPKFGVHFGNYYEHGSFYFLVKPYYIKLSENLGISKDYYSLEGSLSYYVKNWTVSVFGYTGEQVFPVKNGGFTVYNFAEKRLNGYGASIKRVIGQKASLTLSVFRENFKDYETDNRASLNTLVLSLGLTF